MPRKHRFESDAFDHVFKRFVGKDPGRVAGYEAALARAELALMLYELRTGAGLTQSALAKRVGTTASVISRLEDADYEGHSLGMLRRIAAALDKRLELRFVPREARGSRARGSLRDRRRRAVA